MAYLVASLRGAEAQKPQNAAQALHWLRASAEQKNANGQHGLGMAYGLGVGVPKNPVEAVKHYRLAADQNQTHAQAALGLAYATGNGVAQDYAEAVRLLRLAADKNDASARTNLGRMYELGHGVGADLREAVKWYKLAADKNNATAQGNLGWAYQNGRGVDQDNALAYFWYNLAAPRLSGTTQTNVMKVRDEVARKLSAAELQRAQTMAREWKPGQVDAVEAALQEALPAATEAGAGAPSGAASNRRLRGSGTGFVVNKAGHVLTNAHVINDCGDIRARLPGQVAAVAVLVAKDAQNDLAVLKLDAPSGVFAAFRADAAVRQGDSVVVYGFPLGDALAAEGNLTIGNVSALSGLRNDSRLLQVSAPVQPGNSGGPLVDMSGNVIGVVVSKLDAAKVLQVTGDIPQNVNFALKASVARNFLEANGIGYETAPARAPMAAPDIGERVKKVTLKIECWR